MLGDWLTRWLRARPAPLPMVVGVGRSGTTLLRLMLDAHPELAVPAETGFLAEASALAGSGDELRESFFRTATAFPNWADLALPAESFRAALARVEPFSLTQAARCFYRLYARRHGKRRAGDKTPPYALHLDRLHRLLPEARFVHLIRDGRDVARSFRGLWFSPGDDIDTLARTWRDTIVTARRLAAGVPHYLEIRYEDLIRDPEAVLRTICAFVELRYHPAMLRYHEGARGRLDEVSARAGPDGRVAVTKEQRLRLHGRTSRPPEAGRIGLWREELSAAEVARFEALAGGLLADLGYALASARWAA
jgi:hypothetical protein